MQPHTIGSVDRHKRFEAIHRRCCLCTGNPAVVPAPRIHDERIAVIGAGPAGLTAAFNLVRMGYGVTVFEALPVPGGMLTVGIPAYRLPEMWSGREIEHIKKAGVELRLNSPVGANGLTLANLREGYKAVFVATGAHKSLPLGVPGEDMEGVLSGTAFLKDVNLTHSVKIGTKVAVVGGGNVAVDAARAAKRLGTGDVAIVYRRSRDEMPAYPEEVAAAEKEGITIEFLAIPAKVLGKSGKVTGLECVRAKLGSPDESGRRKPEPIQGSQFVVDADMIISAIGEVPELSFLEGHAGLAVGTTPKGQPGLVRNKRSRRLCRRGCGDGSCYRDRGDCGRQKGSNRHE